VRTFKRLKSFFSREENMWKKTRQRGGRNMLQTMDDSELIRCYIGPELLLN